MPSEELARLVRAHCVTVLHDLNGHFTHMLSNQRRLVLLAAGLLGASAVLAGAFGAHALANELSARLLATWEVAVRYHMWHTLVLLVVAFAGEAWSFAPRCMAVASVAFTLGIALFSGSLYALCLSGDSTLGAVTPFGGALLVVAWLLLIVVALRTPR